MRFLKDSDGAPITRPSWKMRKYIITCVVGASVLCITEQVCSRCLEGGGAACVHRCQLEAKDTQKGKLLLLEADVT